MVGLYIGALTNQPRRLLGRCSETWASICMPKVLNSNLPSCWSRPVWSFTICTSWAFEYHYGHFGAFTKCCHTVAQEALINISSWANKSASPSTNPAGQWGSGERFAPASKLIYPPRSARVSILKVIDRAISHIADEHLSSGCATLRSFRLRTDH
jgi:hypothetical protein